MKEDDELDEIGVGLLPKRLLATAKEIVQRRGDVVREGVGVQVIVKRVVAVLGIETDFDVILGPLVTCKDLFTQTEYWRSTTVSNTLTKVLSTYEHRYRDNQIEFLGKKASKLGLQITLAQTCRSFWKGGSLLAQDDFLELLRVRTMNRTPSPPRWRSCRFRFRQHRAATRHGQQVCLGGTGIERRTPPPPREYITRSEMEFALS